MFKDKNNVWILCLKDKVMLRRNKAIVAQNDTTLLSTNCYCSSHKLFISEQLFWHVCNMFQECWKFLHFLLQQLLLPCIMYTLYTKGIIQIKFMWTPTLHQSKTAWYFIKVSTDFIFVQPIIPIQDCTRI